MQRLRAVVLALAVSAGLAPAAMPADLGGGRIKADPIAVAAPSFSWSGLYIGAHVGYGWTNVDWQEVPAFSGNHDGEGWLFGGQVGYNWQNGRWVFGVEADATSSWIEGAKTCCEHNVNWLYSVRGRAGITGQDNRMLYYVTAGGAWADIDYGAGGKRFSDTQFGWVVGGGIERAFTPNLTARVEYLYYAFDDVTAPAGALGAGATSLEPSMHTVRFGLNLKF